jgi:hypothetical protein
MAKVRRRPFPFRVQTRHLGYEPVTSDIHPTPEMQPRRNNRRYVPVADKR